MGVSGGVSGGWGGGVYMVPWYTMESLCDSFSTFHRQDYVLSQQTAGRVRDLFNLLYF